MKIKVTCPHCLAEFEVEVKERRNVSDEVRKARSEHAKSMIKTGRPKGVKDGSPRKTRSDKGKPRMSKKALEFLEKNGIDYVDEK